ncbi:MAG: ATP-binding protein, partial [Bacteroidota bacterium]
DRFVMNKVPLKYWSIIQRNLSGSKIFNYKNSKKVFDEFEFTGLNNFDFFSKNFFENGFKK